MNKSDHKILSAIYHGAEILIDIKTNAGYKEVSYVMERLESMLGSNSIGYRYKWWRKEYYLTMKGINLFEERNGR